MGALTAFAAVTRGARRRGPPQHRGRSALPAKRLADAPPSWGDSASGHHTGPPWDRGPGRHTGPGSYDLRFLFTRLSAIDSFSPSSGITTQAAR
jgi:hypothetical protein